MHEILLALLLMIYVAVIVMLVMFARYSARVHAALGSSESSNSEEADHG